MSKMNPWVPTTNLKELRRLGKTGEEANELGGVCSRAIIQGLLGVDPASGKTNRLRLMEEMADVLAQIELTIEAFDLDARMIFGRVARKRREMCEWEALVDPQPRPDGEKVSHNPRNYDAISFAAFLRDLAQQVEAGQLIHESGSLAVVGPWSNSPSYRLYGDMTFSRPKVA